GGAGFDEARQRALDVRVVVFDAPAATTLGANACALTTRRQVLALQFRDALQNGRSRHARQPRQPTHRAPAFFERLLCDKHPRLRFIQRAQHAQPMPLRLRPPRLRRHRRILSHWRQISEGSSVLYTLFLNSPLAYFFFFKQKTAYEIGLGIPAEPLFRSTLFPAPVEFIAAVIAYYVHPV